MKSFITNFDYTDKVAVRVDIDEESHEWPLDISVADDDGILTSPMSLTTAESLALYHFLKEHYEPQLIND